MRTQRANHMSNNATNGYIKILQHLNSRNWDGTLTYVIRVLIPFLVAGSLLCGAEAFECPAAVAVHEGLAKAIPGWTTMLDDSAHQLAAVTFYDGPPEEKASLVYDRIVKAAGGKQTATWSFKAQAGRQFWMTCSYSGTNVVLKKALPPQITRCSVVYEATAKVAGMPAVEKITCR